MESKPIRLGADPFPPYQYLGEDGAPKGSDWQRVSQTLRRAGYAPQVRIAPWDEVYGAFERGELDGLFQVQDTPERVARYFLSDKLRSAVTLVVTADQALTALDSYQEIVRRELTLGVIEGFANGPEIDSLPDRLKRTYDGTQSVLLAVARGEAALGVCDQGVMEFLTERQPELRCHTVPALVYERPLYVMFRRREDRDAYNGAGALA